jgi:hypothetical protein
MHRLGSIGFNELMTPHAPWNTAAAASPAALAVRMAEDSEGSWGKSTAQDPSEFSMFTGVLILF